MFFEVGRQNIGYLFVSLSFRKNSLSSSSPALFLLLLFTFWVSFNDIALLDCPLKLLISSENSMLLLVAYSFLFLLSEPAGLFYAVWALKETFYISSMFNICLFYYEFLTVEATYKLTFIDGILRKVSSSSLGLLLLGASNDSRAVVGIYNRSFLSIETVELYRDSLRCCKCIGNSVT